MIDSIIEGLKSLQNKSLTVGINGEKGEQKKIVRTISAQRDLKEVKSDLNRAGVKIKGKLTRERTNPNLTVAQVAAYNEFGNSNKSKSPPERSFLRSVLKNRRAEINNLAQKSLKNPESFYDIIGTYILNEIRLGIKRGISPQNADSTVKWKGSSKPLIDTGQLWNSLTYKVSSND